MRNKQNRNSRSLIATHAGSSDARFLQLKAGLPVLEEAAKAKGDELERRLQDKGGGEKVIAVFESDLQGLEKEE